jgi:hypothetical protein
MVLCSSPLRSLPCIPEAVARHLDRQSFEMWMEQGPELVALTGRDAEVEGDDERTGVRSFGRPSDATDAPLRALHGATELVDEVDGDEFDCLGMLDGSIETVAHAIGRMCTQRDQRFRERAEALVQAV